MGGKHKLPQRTKNNVRPSSSSRSAEMLGSLVSSFVGFTTGKDGELVPVLPGLSNKEEFDPNIDNDFKLLFKKMSKKDSTTKLKALQEFTTLVTMSDETYVCSILSLWPRYYSRLALYVVHRVRESTQIANKAVVSKCGRSIAPYLKQLIPIWITSQYDTYTPAAFQAQTALESVFPSSKLPEVIVFCKTEILTFITDNLIVHTPNTLSNPKMFTPEECESKYERVIIGSLQGYSHFINHLPEAQLEWLCSEHVKILDNNKFWELQTNQCPQIRTGYYLVIGSLCQRLSGWFSSTYGKKATESLLTKLNDKDISAPSLWENSILLMASIPEWGTFVDVEKEVLAGACEFLASGGWGGSGRIAPLLLPLTAQFSSRPSLKFHDQFFDSILKGLEQRCVITSKSECAAWLDGFAECVRYVSMNSLDSEEVVPSLSRAMRVWLETAARPHISINPYTPLKLSTARLSSLVLFWTKQSMSAKNPAFSQLIRIFWQNVSFLILSQVEKMPLEEIEIKEIAACHVELLSGLKSCLLEKKTKKITHFKCETGANQSETVAESTGDVRKLIFQPFENDADVKSLYRHQLNTLVYNVCSVYLAHAKKVTLSAPVLAPLYSLIQEFDNPDLYMAMLKNVVGNQSDQKMVNLYKDLLFDWLKGDSMRSIAVVDLVFAMFKHLPEDDQRDVLKSFDQLPLSVIKWCIAHCLAYPHSTCAAVRDWLHSDTVCHSLLTMSRQVAKEGDRHHATLLKMCFAQDNNGDILISEKTCSEIIFIIQGSLVESVHLDMCASFASQLAVSIVADEKCSGYNQLLLSLFSLNCNVKGGIEILSQDTWWEVKTSWQDALPNLSWDSLLWFAENSTDIVYNKVVDSNSALLDGNLLDILADLTIHLINSCVNFESETDDKWTKLCQIIKIVLKLESEDLKSCLSNIYLISLNADVINLKFGCFTDNNSPVMNSIIENGDKKSCFDVDEVDLKKMIRWTVCRTTVLYKMIFIDKDEQELKDDAAIRLKDVMTCNEIINIFSIHLYNICVIRTLSVEYKAWKWCEIVVEYYLLLIDTMQRTVRSLSVEHYNSLFNHIEAKAEDEGLSWTSCLCFLESIAHPTQKRKYDLNRVTNDFVAKLRAGKNLQEILSHNTFNNIMIVVNVSHNDNYREHLAKVHVTFALRSIYLAFNKKKKSAINITNESFLECMDTPLKGLGSIIDMYYQCKELMLYDLDFTLSDWDLVQCNACIVNLLTVSIETIGWELESHHWDFITISLSSLMQSIEKCKNSWSTAKVSLLGCAVFKLFIAVEMFLKRIPQISRYKEPTAIIASLPQEWSDIFAPDINLRFLEIFMAVVRDCLSSTKICLQDVLFLSALSDGIKNIKCKYFASNTDSAKYSLDSVVEICLEVMSASTHHVLKFIAYRMISKITPALKMADDVITTTTFQKDSVDSLPLTVYKMVPTLCLLQTSVQDCLSLYKIGEDHPVLLPHTESYNTVLGYIFLWETVLNITRESAAWAQHQYTELFRENQYVVNLLSVLFRLLPSELLSTDTIMDATDPFRNQPELDAKVAVTSKLIGDLASHCLTECLRGGSTAILTRSWWGCLPSRLSQTIGQIVSRYISNILISQLLTNINTRSAEFPHAQIHVDYFTNIIVCTYTIEGKDMTLTIRPLENYPLSVPQVSSKGTLTNPVPWITMLLSYQNSSVFQALTLWINSLHRKMESAPECYVCYAKLHYKTGELPKSLCRVCKNKFHKSCLMKWFNKSTKATCPLCRSNFNHIPESNFFETQH